MYGKRKEMQGKWKGLSSSELDAKEAEFKDLDIKKMLKDIEFLSSSNMSWKERKELENRKVVSLGGKPPKKHRIPLSVARVTMKKQKDREQKMPNEGVVLGRFGTKSSSRSSSRVPEKRKAEDRVFKTTQGHFSKGVLDVKEFLRHDRYGSKDSDSRPMGGGGGGGKRHKEGKHKGKKKGKKGGGKKRR